jgi:RIO kinase 1
MADDVGSDDEWVPPAEVHAHGHERIREAVGQDDMAALERDIAASLFAPAATRETTLGEETGSAEYDDDDFADDDDIAVNDQWMRGAPRPAPADRARPAPAKAMEEADEDARDEDDLQRGGGYKGKAASSAAAAALAALEGQYSSRIKFGMLEQAAARAPRHTGRDDRATVELVLDPRTQLMLFRLVQQGIVGEIHGCVSTGKEANVYYATRGPCAQEHPSVMGSTGGRAVEEEDSVMAPGGFALKVFKTSILVFKDRDRYVSGEYRFRSGYSRRNPRKMVKVWAEKEIRNLRRLQAAGIPCPTPRLLRGHVLMMDFVGDDGWPAPRLRDAKLSESKQMQAYEEVVWIMRRMWTQCRLVHADLSEYNLLWYRAEGEKRGKVVVIDVSQSVESDHPRAMEFLKQDCDNVTAYFGKRCGLRVMTPRELFEFITRADLPTAEAEVAALDAIWHEVRERPAGQVFLSAEDEAEHRVFMQSFIPRTLADYADAEQEIDRAAAGEESYATALLSTPGAPEEGKRGRRKVRRMPAEAPTADEVAAAEEAAALLGIDTSMLPGFGTLAVTEEVVWEGEEEEEEEEEGDDADDEETAEEAQFTLKGASREERKAHKAATKALNREKRSTKMKKAAKKEKVKATRRAGK